MRRRLRATLTLAVTASLAVPLALAGPAQAERKPPVVEPGVDDTRVVARAAAEAVAAAARQQDVPRARASQPDSVIDALEDALDAAVDGIPVGVTARVDTPDLRWKGSAGQRQLDERAPARAEDVFRVGSITKPMVTTLALQEVERGTWSLDTPIVDVLPEAAGVIPAEHQDAVTIELLLSHRSGMPDHLGPLLSSRITDPNDVDEQFAVMGQEYTTADHLAAMTAQPWLFEPGTSYRYSNAGFVLIGLALEEVTGQDLESLLEQRVFRPAGMSRTGFPDDPQDRGPFLVDAAHTGEYGQGWYSLGHFDPSMFYASGAVTSTTGDLHRFIEALFTGKLIDPASVAEMAMPRTEDSYGLGLFRIPDPCRPGEWLYGHDGATFGTLSITLASEDGERRLAVSLTGRDYLSNDPLADLKAVLVPAYAATC